MPSLFPLIASLLFLVPAQEPSQDDLLDVIKELGIQNEYIRSQAEVKIQKLGARLVPVIRKELATGSLQARRRAAKAASLIGADAEPLVGILIEQIANNDPELRGNALAALGGIGAPARRALEALDKLTQPLDPETTRLLMVVRERLMEDPSKLWPTYLAASRDPDPRMRFAGVFLAFKWCKARKDIVPQFLPLTRDPDPEVRRQAQLLMASLKNRGRDELDVIAHGKNPLRSVQAMMMLGHFDLTKEQLAFLLEELEARPRNQAAREGLLAAGEMAYPKLLSRFAVLVSEKAAPEVLDRFLFYFQGYGSRAMGAGKELRLLLDRPERDLRLRTLETLRDTGFEDRAAERAILEQISPKERKNSEMAIAALGSSRNPSPEMLGLLVGLVAHSKNSAIRRHASEALGRLEDRAEPVFAELAAVLEADDVKGRGLAALAFGQMGPKAISFLIARYSRTKDAKDRQRILAAFGELGPKARAALPLMQEALASENQDLREVSLVALARIGDAGRVAIPKMLTILEKTDEKLELRLAACTALSLLGVGDPRLIQPLIATSRSSNKELAQLSLISLGELGLIEALPRLLEALEDPDPQLRWRAAYAIGRLGLIAVKALPALKARMGDDDDAVRYQAEKAFRELRGR